MKVGDFQCRLGELKKFLSFDFEELVLHSKTLQRIVSAKNFKLFCEMNLKANPSLVARANIKLMESKQRLVDPGDWFSLDYCLLESPTQFTFAIFRSIALDTHLNRDDHPG